MNMMSHGGFRIYNLYLCLSLKTWNPVCSSKPLACYESISVTLKCEENTKAVLGNRDG